MNAIVFETALHYSIISFLFKRENKKSKNHLFAFNRWFFTFGTWRGNFPFACCLLSRPNYLFNCYRLIARWLRMVCMRLCFHVYPLLSCGCPTAYACVRLLCLFNGDGETGMLNVTNGCYTLPLFYVFQTDDFNWCWWTVTNLAELHNTCKTTATRSA